MRRTNSEVIAISSGGWRQPKQPGRLRASLQTLERTRSEGSFVKLERNNEQSRSLEKLRRSISDSADLYPGFASPFARAGGKQLGVPEKPHRDTPAKSRKHESRRKKARHASGAKPAAGPSLPVDSAPSKVVKRKGTRRDRGDAIYVPLNDVGSENLQTLPEKSERTTRSNRRRRLSEPAEALPSPSTEAAPKQNVRHVPINESPPSQEGLPTPPRRERFNPLLTEQDLEKSKPSSSRTTTVRWEFPPPEDVDTALDPVSSKSLTSITGNQKEIEVELDADIIPKSHVAVPSRRDTIREPITSKPARPMDSPISLNASNASDQEKLHEGNLKQPFVEGHSTAVLVVKVLSSSWLPPNMRITRPVVLGHLLDGVQGVYLKDDAKVLKTKPYDLISHGTLVPQWNEELIFPIGEASALGPNSILLFEVSGQDASLPVASVLGTPMPLQYRIAWGFLKLAALVNKRDNGKMSRLQLYAYPENAHYSTHDSCPAIFRCFEASEGRREPYPATLLVSASIQQRIQNPIGDPKDASLRLAEREPTHQHQGSAGRSDSPQAAEEPLPNSVRRRLGRCSLPKTCLYNVEAGVGGASACCFSNDGSYLAVACLQASSYPVQVHRTLTGDRIAILHGHLGLIYQVVWDADDRGLFSASSDGTVRHWISNEPGSWECAAVYHHPSFVYATELSPVANKPRLIATGCHDALVRLWPLKPFSQRQARGAVPLRILSGHASGVHSVTFERDGHRLFTGDATGLIKVWRGGDAGKYTCISDITLFQNSIINLSLHPIHNRILVRCASAGMYTIDTRTFRILTAYQPTFETSFTRPNYSPCGSFVLCGAEDGRVLVWDTDFSEILPSQPYVNLGLGCIMQVAYHPHYDMCAFAGIGSDATVSVWSRAEDSQSETKPIKVDAPHWGEHIAAMQRNSMARTSLHPLPEKERTGLQRSRVGYSFESRRRKRPSVSHQGSEGLGAERVQDEQDSMENIDTNRPPLTHWSSQASVIGTVHEEARRE
ncbi:WD40-repeat-containing domain protein [Gaertneriomyces semiglobifer]|nr:WD40-repeat-containing domain protein [Gaertneriomyces semiglobifer]